jgi:hypothetical protein
MAEQRWCKLTATGVRVVVVVTITVMARVGNVMVVAQRGRGCCKSDSRKNQRGGGTKLGTGNNHTKQAFGAEMGLTHAHRQPRKPYTSPLQGPGETGVSQPPLQVPKKQQQ